MKVLCYHCHLNYWHKHPMAAAEWFAAKYPERWAYLKEEQGIRKFTIAELEELAESLKAQLE
jgi:prephenate dehydrogenase